MEGNPRLTVQKASGDFTTFDESEAGLACDSLIYRSVGSFLSVKISNLDFLIVEY